VLVFLLEALLFVLIGQQLPSILEGLGEYSATHVLLYVALVYAVLTGTRSLWFFTTPSLPLSSLGSCGTGTCAPRGRSAS
jgi:NhaP-type Na+/H+ or K+/H+ antiporter